MTSLFINTISFLLILFSIAFSSCNENDIEDFIIEELFFNESIVGYYLGGFDISSGATDVLLFEYLVKGPASCYDSSLDLNLKYNIEIFSPTLGFLTPTPFVDGSLEFSNIYGPISLRNTDINFNTQTIEGAVSFSPGEPNISVTKGDLENMTNYIMTTGKVPNGTYVFRFELYHENKFIDAVTRDVEIYEPTFLELLSPGYKNITESNESPVFNSYPVFTWSADMCSSCNYGIRVCEYDQSIHSSFSDAMNDISVLPSNQSLDYHSIPEGTSIFQYPSSGAFDLEPGNTYVWQLKRDYGTTVGLKEDFSDIFAFKISSFQSSDTSNLDFIKDLIGEDNYEILFGPGGELEGFSLSGISLDGEQSTLQDIQSIILDIQQGNKKLSEYSVD